MEIVELDHTEWCDGEYHHYEVYKCPTCERTYFYDTDCLHERLNITYACPCGCVYRFDAEKWENAVMPELIADNSGKETA